MGMVRTEITLRNFLDKLHAHLGFIKEQEVREIRVNALVDTGAFTLVINEETREKLGLEITGSRPATLANGKRDIYNLAGQIEVRWKERYFYCDALVVPEGKEILLGALPLEAMDLIINPLKEEVVGAHGEEEMHYLYKCA
jgi:clan AA aspartic protease